MHLLKLLLINAALIILLPATSIRAQTVKETLETNFVKPPKDYWPHTRWWWPGNAGSKEEITRELEQMRSHGIRGVEQISMDPVFEKGNVPYLSDEFMGLLTHAVKEAKRLDMEVSLNFGGPGWIIGGEFVPQKDRSKDLVPTFVDLTGPQTFKGDLPNRLIKTKRSWEVYTPYLNGEEQLIAAIAGRMDKSGKLIEKSLINLTLQVKKQPAGMDSPGGRLEADGFLAQEKRYRECGRSFQQRGHGSVLQLPRQQILHCFWR